MTYRHAYLGQQKQIKNLVSDIQCYDKNRERTLLQQVQCNLRHKT